MNTGSIIGIIFLLIILFGIISTTITIFNRIVSLKFNTEKAFSNIDVLLKQRADEIPNLVEVVKQSGAYEKDTLTKITELRTQYLKSNKVNEKVDLSNKIEKALSKFMFVSEDYPDLKANKNFIVLQNRLSTLEDHIADRRELFNESINMYNIGINQFPNIIIAQLLRFKSKPMLQITNQEKSYDGVKF